MQMTEQQKKTIFNEISNKYFSNDSKIQFLLNSIFPFKLYWDYLPYILIKLFFTAKHGSISKFLNDERKFEADNLDKVYYQNLVKLEGILKKKVQSL